jgi:hypothetical protein
MRVQGFRGFCDARAQAAEEEAGLPAGAQVTLAFNRARVLEAAGSAQAAAREYEGILQACCCLLCLQLEQRLRMCSLAPLAA